MITIVRRFIEEAGNTTQSLGLGRVAGQLYAYLYFSDVPRNLADMQKELGISKGSASTTVRQLEQWGAVRKVWIKGDRKDFYEADTWFGKILKNAVADIIGKRLRSYSDLLQNIEIILDAEKNGDDKFVRGQLKKIKDFHRRVQGIWENPFLKEMLK